MEIPINKKPISEFFSIVKQEITNPKKFVLVTVSNDDNIDTVVGLSLARLKDAGLEEILNPVVYVESLPNFFDRLQTPDFVKWGWTDEMFQEWIPSPLLAVVVDKPSKFESIKTESEELDECVFFMSGKLRDIEKNDLTWFNSIITKYELWEDRKIAPLTKEELEKNEYEDGAKYDSRFISVMLSAGIRPSSLMTEYVGGRQYAVDNNKEEMLRHHVSTPKFSELVDNSLLRTGNYSLGIATEWIELSVHLDPKNFVSWTMLGSDYKRTGDYEKAENCFRQSIMNNASYRPPYSFLGHLLAEQYLLKKAIEVVDEGLTRHNHYDLHGTKALCLLEMGEYERSFSEIKTAQKLLLEEKNLKKDLRDEAALFLIFVAVNALLEEKRFSEVVTTYEPVVSMFPESAVSHNNFGVFLQLDGQHERAVESWKRCISIEPNNWSALLSLGIHYQEKMSYAEASLYFDKSLKTCPESIKKKIEDRALESLRKFRDTNMMKTFSEQVSSLGGFMIDGNRESDVKKFVNLLGKCEGEVLWIDPYFSKEGLVWIEESCMHPTKITKVRIMTTPKREEITSRPFRKKFLQIKNKLEKNSIPLSIRIVSNAESIRKMHGRFIISQNGSWSVPSVNNIQSGTADVISPSVTGMSDFEQDWNDAKDII